MPNANDMRDDGLQIAGAKRAFVALWLVVLLLKLGVATQLPLFVDEAFYWQEGQHPGWAYSDLPGLTAWLIRLGVEVAGNNHFGVRLPFLLMGAALPWMMVGMVRRELGEGSAPWLAGSATVLLPLAGTLGIMALPDVPMALATMLCLDAGARLLRRVDNGAVLLLALGLAIGALSHYRFIAVIGVGVIALALLPGGRRALRDPRVWIAVAFGAAAWVPLLAWNIENAEAGLRFQLVERHPWALHASGFSFIPLQAAFVTPLLLAGLLLAGWRGAWRGEREVVRLFGLLGGLVVLGFFALGFFADTERVSFHWPLPGYLALIPLLPALLASWPRWLRRATWALAGAGLVAVFAYYAAVSIPSVRAQSAAWKWYPSNFAGWNVLADAVEEELAQMPEGTRLVADNFKIGAELGFRLDNPRIKVLDHPLNRFHGRAPQLQLWGLETAGRSQWGDDPVLLVVGASDVSYRNLLRRYHALCERVGPLPAPRRVLNVDHGSQRFLVFALDPDAGDSAGCTAPAMAWIDTPVSGGRTGWPMEVTGWAFKDGVGLSRVEVLLDGVTVAEAEYGLDVPYVASYWQISNDPSHPGVGFQATLGGQPPARPGRYWLGLRLHGQDGSVEEWSEQPVIIE
ncbi:glycosyltransferase family 39 protein [Luteimonas sp. A478]